MEKGDEVMSQNAIYKQWDNLVIQEKRHLEKCAEKKPSSLEGFVADKVPPKLQDTLNLAFAKSFGVVFDKGTSIIEKSYKRDEIEHTHKVNSYAFSLRPDKKRVRAFENEALKSQTKNVLISGAKGVGLGLFGIGLPDIPIFIGMVLKGIYEIALEYGYDYDSEQERYFILGIIGGALSYGHEAVETNERLNEFIGAPALPQDYDRQCYIDAVAGKLSTELLCMKFVQGLPFVGVVGGVFDAVFIQRILSYAKLKYKRRFLSDKMGF